MSWGKKDKRLSKMLYENGLFLDKRSRVVYDPEMKPHLKLRGDDVVLQRQRVVTRSHGKCGICKEEILYHGDADMDHIQGGDVARCDCLHNLRFVHKGCHRRKHVRPMFTSAGVVQVQLKSVPMEAES